jgi:hypothetical protein
MPTALDYTIRYEGTEWVLYRYLSDAGPDGKRTKVYLGTYRHKEKAVEARDINIRHHQP